MTKEILIVGVGSFAGGALRYILSVGLSKLGRLWAFPIGIMVINILGCFLIGVTSKAKLLQTLYCLCY